MTKRYLQILSFITIFAVNGIKSDDTIEALRKILKELNAPNDERYDAANHNSKIVYHPHHHKHSKFKGSGSPNLMNVQTMNLYMKPNKRQREEADVKRLLRSDTMNMCKAGRCGCTGTRCGKNREDDLADEIDRIVNEINKQLSRDDDETRKDRNRVTLDDERDERNRDEARKRDLDDRNRGRIEDDQQEDRDDEDRIKKTGRYDDDNDEIKHDRDDDENDDYYGRLFDTKNRADKDDLLKSKRIKVNDNLDVIILDKSDLDVLLRNDDFLDLTRTDVEDYDKDKKIFETVLEESKKLVATEDKVGRSTDVITPEDFFRHYESVKQQVVAKVFDYVKDKKLSTFLNIKHLSPFQKSKLRSVKLKFQRGQLEDDALEEEIVKIIFGDQSDMKILAQTENNKKIYVPKWIYDKILSSKKNININVIRAQNTQKRILPLTSQQKERLKNKTGKTYPKLVWRKRAAQDVQRFGIPFDFEVHGLAQMAT